MTQRQKLPSAIRCIKTVHKKTRGTMAFSGEKAPSTIRRIKTG